MSICSKQLNPFQRRFVRMCAITLILTAGLFLLAESFREGSSIHLGSASGIAAHVLPVLPVIPFAVMMLLIPRYFAQEKDEFVRMLVTRALLWGFAVPMVIDTVWGFVLPARPVIPMINVDLFCITVLFAVGFQSRRYQ